MAVATLVTAAQINMLPLLADESATHLSEAKPEQAIAGQALTVVENAEFIDGIPALIISADQVDQITRESTKSKVLRASAEEKLEKQLKLGFSALTNKNWAGADYIYGEITKSNDSNAQAWLGLGLARFKLNDKDAALKAFQKAATLAPGDAATQAALQLANGQHPENNKAPGVLEKMPSGGKSDGKSPAQTATPSGHIGYDASRNPL